MSQNQSYFWQTTRHNVYLRRASKLHMLFALLAVMTFATICADEVSPKDNQVTTNDLTKNSFEMDVLNDLSNGKVDAANESPNDDAPKDSFNKAGFIDAFTASISVILFTELGDKTFFIAAIMAMRHPRFIVFVGAITALALMTVLSVVFGMAATIIPKVYTYYISTALFAIFGLKMIYEGYFMKATDAQEELEEVQSDLRKREDELLRSVRSKSIETEPKRKNSNSDKDEFSIEESSVSLDTTTSGRQIVNISKNPEMQHRQRKQMQSSNINNNVDCDINDTTESLDDSQETEVFLKPNGINDINSANIKNECIKLSTFHKGTSSSSFPKKTKEISVEDNNKQSTNSSINILRSNGTSDEQALILASTDLTKTSANITIDDERNVNQMNSNKINGCVNHKSTSSIEQPNAELKLIGGSKKRLERDVSSAHVQDPESGIVRKNTKKSATYLTTRVFMQAFTMTFLAEWGDRSQLTTIILAASKNVYGVIVGGVLGHSICTGLAVIGGRMVAAKISVRTVTIVGGIVFLGFAVYALIFRPDDI